MDLAFAPIRRMEPAIIERLRVAFPPKTFGIERVPQVLTLTEFKRIARLSPFIGLAWVGMRPDKDSGRALKGDMLWRLILVNKASNGLQAIFHGDKLGIGLDAMVDVAAALLHWASIDGTGKATVTGANSVIADGYTDEDVGIVQLDFSISFVTSPADFSLVTIDNFLRLGVSWAVSDNPASDGAESIVEPPEE